LNWELKNFILYIHPYFAKRKTLMKILVINPGSTSDEISFFENEKLVFEKTVRYHAPELKKYEGQKVTSQYEFRKKVVLDTLKEKGISPDALTAVIGRGGLVKPIPSGTYEVTPKLIDDLSEGVMGDHPSNLGGLLANEIAKLGNARAFIADPVVVDEMDEVARYSGMPENPRISIFHALNQKRVARLAAKELGKKEEECNFIVMHGGGGISIGAHRGGKVVDVNNALDGDGPFTPQRSGGVPSGGLAKMCFSGKYTLQDIKLKLKGRGGMVAYTGSSDMITISEYATTGKADPDSGIDPKKISRQEVQKCIEAMAYQIAKEIGSMATVLKGKVDAIVLTGGLAYNPTVMNPLRERISWISKIIVYPGGDEKSALHEAAVLALKNPETIKKYN
jgi:butyrate kinase